MASRALQSCQCKMADTSYSSPNSFPGTTPHLSVRIWTTNPVAMTWDFVPYELAPVPANASWVDLSEITRVGDGSYVLIEHDNRTGDFAALKTLIRVSLTDATDGITAEEKTVYDLIPDLKATHGWITDKPEGVAINRHGEVFVVTDNDGVGDWSGETWFLKLGNVDDLFEFEGGNEGRK